MPNSDVYTAKQFIDEIPGTGGVITKIAARVGCSWHTAKKYIDSYATVQRAYSDECEAVLDKAESNIIKDIEAGDISTSRWYLSTKGRKRGYVEKQELEHTGTVVIGIGGIDPDEDI